MYIGEIKRITKDSEMDVMALENRTYLLQKGYLKIGQKEQNPEYIINQIKKTNSDMLSEYSLVQMRLKSALEMIQAT